jgi:hypothetical protein
MTHHTPGPWKVAKVGKVHIYINDVDDDGTMRENT